MSLGLGSSSDWDGEPIGNEEFLDVEDSPKRARSLLTIASSWLLGGASRVLRAFTRGTAAKRKNVEESAAEVFSPLADASPQRPAKRARMSNQLVLSPLGAPFTPGRPVLSMLPQEEPSDPAVQVSSSTDFWRIQVEAIYCRRNPYKLHSVPALLEKYRGREVILYRKICQTYDLDASKFYHETSAWGEENNEDDNTWLREDDSRPWRSSLGGALTGVCHRVWAGYEQDVLSVERAPPKAQRSIFSPSGSTFAPPASVPTAETLRPVLPESKLESNLAANKRGGQLQPSTCPAIHRVSQEAPQLKPRTCPAIHRVSQEVQQLKPRAAPQADSTNHQSLQMHQHQAALPEALSASRSVEPRPRTSEPPASLPGPSKAFRPAEPRALQLPTGQSSKPSSDVLVVGGRAIVGAKRALPLGLSPPDAFKGKAVQFKRRKLDDDCQVIKLPQPATSGEQQGVGQLRPERRVWPPRPPSTS